MRKKTKPKVGIYCRVSTTDKQTTKSQRHAIREWAKGAHVPESELVWYEDRRSGKSLEGRDALARMLKHVAAGRLDCVVVYDLSRLARNLADGIKVLADLSAKVRVVSVSESIDFSNSTGQLIAQILLAVYSFQRLSQNERIRQGLAARRAEGHRLGRPRDDRRLSEVAKMHRDGMGVTEIAAKLGCSRQNVYALLDRSKEFAA